MILKNRSNLKQFIFMVLGIMVVIVHLMVGYVFPGIVCVIMAISYVAVVTSGKTWVSGMWFASVMLSYTIIDVITYTPDGTSAMYYKGSLAALFSILTGMILCIACTLSAKEACNSNCMDTCSKIKKIRASASLFCFYAVPTVVLIVGSTIYNVVKTDMFVVSSSLVSTGLITLCTMAILNFILYIGTTLFERGVLRSDEDRSSGTDKDIPEDKQ